jgi:hypothetical protein
MPNFAIDWTRGRKNDDRWVVQATLVERIVLDAAPRLKIVCNLARIDEARIGDTAARDQFWHDAGARLGRLYRLTIPDIVVIEHELAKRVPKPAPIYTQTMRPSAHPVRGPHRPTVIRAR